MYTVKKRKRFVSILPAQRSWAHLLHTLHSISLYQRCPFYNVFESSYSFFSSNYYSRLYLYFSLFIRPVLFPFSLLPFFWQCGVASVTANSIPLNVMTIDQSVTEHQVDWLRLSVRQRENSATILIIESFYISIYLPHVYHIICGNTQTHPDR